MSEKYIDRLKGEHARLEQELAKEEARVLPDQIQIQRLKKLKLAVKDLMAMVEKASTQLDRAA